MPSIHSSFFFPLSWLPSPIHNKYFDVSNNVISARQKLQKLFHDELNRQKQNRRIHRVNKPQPSMMDDEDTMTFIESKECSTRVAPYFVPIERHEWLRLDTLLLKERERNSAKVNEYNQQCQQKEEGQDSPSSIDSNPANNSNNYLKSPNAFQAMKLIESENELAVDQFDTVVQLCTKMVYQVVSSNSMCCVREEMEQTLKQTVPTKQLGYLPLHELILKKTEEIYWRKFIEIIFLKLIVDPKVILVGLHYFAKVIQTLEMEKQVNQSLGTQSPSTPTVAFNRNELKTLICICIMLASKMYDEDMYWKTKSYFKLFSSLCRKREDHRRLTFKEFNHLEIEVLNILGFHLTLNMELFSKEIVSKHLKIHFDEDTVLLVI
ncbi:hypothetical protein ABK040_008798 [Willaertia magna]